MPIRLHEDPKNIFFRCVEDCNEAIMICDAQGDLLYVNPAWERIYGYRKEEAIGKNPRILQSGQQSSDFYGDMWRRITQPELGHWSGELINRSKDGTLVPVLLTITPYRDPQGVIQGYMGFALDLSGRKELEAKIVHQDRLASVGLLASGLAHEVGTPLGVIRGRAEFLMMREKESSELKSLEIIVSQIDRIAKLIRSLLRIGRSPADPKVQRVAIAPVIEDVLALVAQHFRDLSAEISLEVPVEQTALADTGRLEQVLLNLLTNAIHAIQKAVHDGRTGPHFLRLRSRQQENSLVLDVEDSGCGIAPANMSKLFQPFFTTKDIGEGTGLGLAIVAQLLREMQGDISVRSHPGEGTVFSVYLRS